MQSLRSPLLSNGNTGISKVARAAFSTSRVVCAERPKSSAASDLATIDAPPAQSHQFGGNRYQTHRKTFSPINIPNKRGGLRNPAASQAENSHEKLQSLIAEAERKTQAKAVAALARGKASATTAEMLERDEMAKNLTQQIKRHFKPGDVYAPHDLSWQEQKRWQRRTAPKYDVFDQTNFNPKDHYKNFMVLSEFITPMGRIMHSKETGLRPVNQRRIAKAVRRAVGMGIMPSVHKHPELLQQVARARVSSSMGFF